MPHPIDNGVSVAARQVPGKARPAGNIRHIAKGRNAAGGLPAATLRARPQAHICSVVGSPHMPDTPTSFRLASGRLWAR